nr:uncharacterized protein LOC112312824 isoform X7 [Desmodus rotundus]
MCKRKETWIHWGPSPAGQAYTLTGDQTCNLLVWTTPNHLAKDSWTYSEGAGENDQVPGGGDVQGRGCDLHRGGAGAARAFPKDAVPRRDPGEPQEPGLCGTLEPK